MSTLGLSFFLYTAGILAVGIYSTRFARKTSSDFLLADRGLGAWVAALSSSASAESGLVTLGLVGMAFKTGAGALWIIPGTVAAFVFNWVVVAPRLRRASREHEGLTLPDILAQPYPGKVKFWGNNPFHLQTFCRPNALFSSIFQASGPLPLPDPITPRNI